MFYLGACIFVATKSIRADEMRSLKLLHISKSAIRAKSMALPIFSSMAAFVVFSRVGSDLQPPAVFSSLAYSSALVRQ